MPSETLLIGFSQLGASYIAFIAIVVAFVRKDGKLSPIDALRVRSILYSAFLVVIGGLAPLVLSAYAIPGEDVLKIAAGAGLVCGFGTGFEGARFHASMSAADKKASGVVHGVFSWGLALLAQLLLLMILFGIGDPVGHYVLALSIGITIATSNFLMTALQKWLTGFKAD